VIAGITAQQVRKYVSVMEMINTLDVPSAGGDANEIWVLASEFFRDEEPTGLNQQEGREPSPDPYHYPDWDYQMQLDRPDWCRGQEKRPEPGDVEVIDDIVVKHKPLVARLKFLIEAMQPQGVQRLRKQEDGDEIDLNAAVRAMVDMRMGEQTDPRIMMRSVRKVRDLSVLLLIDLSESTNDTVLGSDSTVLQLARDRTSGYAETGKRITRVGVVAHPGAWHGAMP